MRPKNMFRGRVQWPKLLAVGLDPYTWSVHGRPHCGPSFYIQLWRPSLGLPCPQHFVYMVSELVRTLTPGVRDEYNQKDFGGSIKFGSIFMHFRLSQHQRISFVVQGYWSVKLWIEKSSTLHYGCQVAVSKIPDIGGVAGKKYWDIVKWS